MRIAIDLRSLQTGTVSGVENYVTNLTEQVLKQDRKNSYALFYNSFKKLNFPYFNFINSKIVRTKYPNRVLNLSFSLLGRPKMERLLGAFDCLFLPNLNPFAIEKSTKLIITVHDLSPVLLPKFYSPKHNLWQKFLNIKKSLQRANAIIAVSHYTKIDLQRIYNIPDDKIKVIYPGLDFSLFNSESNLEECRDIRNKFGLPGRYLLFLSTVEPRKNILGLLDAFENLDSKTSLVIAGKFGWQYKQALQKAKKSKKKHKIKFLNYVTEHEKPYLIKMARAVVYPSFYEGFGFVPLEAAACGVPVVTSALTSLPEINKDSALICNPYDINSLTRALAEISSNQILRDKLIDKGLEVAKQYSWNKSAEQVINIFNNLN